MNYFEDSKTIKIETARLALRYFTLEDCGTGASILQGWTDRFYIRIPSDAYNVKTKSF